MAGRTAVSAENDAEELSCHAVIKYDQRYSPKATLFEDGCGITRPGASEGPSGDESYEEIESLR